MENFLSCLNSHTNLWLSCDLTFLDIDPTCTLQSAVVLLLLFLCSLLLKQLLPVLWKNEDIQKHPGRTKKRRGGKFKGQRTDQRDQEEGRKLFSVLKSSLGQHHNSTHFRQLLCPDPLCKVCNSAAAEVSRLLSRASLEDAAHTVSRLPPMDSMTRSSFPQIQAISAVPPEHPMPASLTKTSLPLPSILPCKQVASLVDSLSPSAVGDSVALEPKLPLGDHFPLEPILSPLPPPHHSQEAEPVVQLEAILSPDDSSGELSTNNLSSAEPSFGGYSTGLNPETQVPLESGIKETDDLLMGKEKQKGTESFSKQHEPDDPLHFAGNRSEPTAHQQCPEPCLPFWSRKTKPKELHMNQKPEGPKTLEDYLEQKCSQFCQVPGLPRESLNSHLPTSGDCFRAISNIFKTSESPDLLHTRSVFLPEVQPQPITHSPPQSLSQHLCLPTEIQEQLPPSTSILPDSPLDQIGSCGMCFSNTQSEVQSLTLSEIHNLESEIHNVNYNVLQKVQENMDGLSSVVQKSQEDFCPPVHTLPLVSQYAKAHMTVSVLPKNSTFNSELREKLEHHLQRKLVQHQWGLPSKVLKSLSSVQVPEDTCLNPQGISFLNSSKHKMLEDRIKTFRSRMMWDLPHKVQKSIEIFNQEQHLCQVSSHSKFLSSNMSVSSVDSKIRVYKPLRRSLNSQGYKMGTTKPVVDYLHPATSPVGEGSQEALRQSSSYSSHGLPENIGTEEDDTQTFLLHINSNTGTVSQKETLQNKRHSQKPTTRLAGVGLEVSDKRMTSGDVTERLPSKMTAKLEYFPMCNKSREILKRKESCTLQSQSSNILMTSELEEGVLGRDLNASEPETTLTAKRPATRTEVPQELKSSDSKNQLINEPMFEMESREQSQFQGLPTDVSFEYNDLKTETLLSHDQGVSSGDMAASQVMCVDIDKAKNVMEQGQETWVPNHVLELCEDKNFPVAGRVCPPAVKAGKLCRGHAGLGTLHPQERTLEGTLGRKSSPTMPLKGQPPPESPFKSKMKHFFQWLSPSVRYKGKESSSVKVRAALTGTTTDEKFSRDSVMVSEEKPQLTCGIDVASSSSPFYPLRRPGENSTRQKVQDQAESAQGYPPSYSPSCCTMPNVQSYSTGPGLLAQTNYMKNRPDKVWDKQLPKDIPCNDQKHHLAMLCREAVPSPSLSCGPQVDQVPLDACNISRRIVSESFSLLLKEKILLQHFEARTFPNLSLIKNTN